MCTKAMLTGTMSPGRGTGSLQKTARPFVFQGLGGAFPHVVPGREAGAAPRMLRCAPADPERRRTASSRPPPAGRGTPFRLPQELTALPSPRRLCSRPPPPHGCPPTAGSARSHPAVSQASPKPGVPGAEGRAGPCPVLLTFPSRCAAAVEGGFLSSAAFPLSLLLPSAPAEGTLSALPSGAFGFGFFFCWLRGFFTPVVDSVPPTASPAAAPTLQSKGPSEERAPPCCCQSWHPLHGTPSTAIPTAAAWRHIPAHRDGPTQDAVTSLPELLCVAPSLQQLRWPHAAGGSLTRPTAVPGHLVPVLLPRRVLSEVLLCANTFHLALISVWDHQSSCMHRLWYATNTPCMQHLLQCSSLPCAHGSPWLGIADVLDPCRHEAMSHRAMFGGFPAAGPAGCLHSAARECSAANPRNPAPGWIRFKE